MKGIQKINKRFYTDNKDWLNQLKKMHIQVPLPPQIQSFKRKPQTTPSSTPPTLTVFDLQKRNQARKHGKESLIKVEESLSLKKQEWDVLDCFINLGERETTLVQQSKLIWKSFDS